MLSFDKELARTGGNQLGVLAAGAALVAFFIEPGHGLNILWLAIIGTILYIVTAIRRDNAAGNSAGGDNPGGA